MSFTDSVPALLVQCTTRHKRALSGEFLFCESPRRTPPLPTVDSRDFCELSARIRSSDFHSAGMSVGAHRRPMRQKVDRAPRALSVSTRRRVAPTDNDDSFEEDAKLEDANGLILWNSTPDTARSPLHGTGRNEKQDH